MIPASLSRARRRSPSRTALAILCGAVLLAVLLAAATAANISREEDLMKRFLLHEGLTLIRAFEAGARTTMMHRMSGDDPMETLVRETVKEPSVVYIRVVGADGRELAAGGEIPAAYSGPPPARVLEADAPLTTLTGKGADAVFEIAAPFEPVRGQSPWAGRGMGRNHGMGMGGRWGMMWMREPVDQGPMVIYLGLTTAEFESARQADLGHAVLMGAILFLAGIAGLYLLFVHQGKRVAERTLADMESYTRSVIESMPSGLVTLDDRGCVVSCNAEAERILGREFSALAGRKLAAEFPSLPLPTVDDPPLHDQAATCGGEGSGVPVRLSSSTLRAADGGITGLVLMMRDVSDLLEMEEKLERARRLASLGRMAAGIAHEIRNPLGTLRGFAQFFRNSFAPDDPGRGYAELMVEEIDRLNRLISGLLQFARPREPRLEEVSLKDLFAKAVTMMGDDCARHGIDLRIDSVGVPPLCADPDLVFQALINLVKNSVEACQAGAVITLGTRRDEERIALVVTDTGKGLDEEERRRMFDPFYTTRKTGTGLGLAIVHQIMEQHHGTVTVRSAPGAGTRISLVFPLSQKGGCHDA